MMDFFTNIFGKLNKRIVFVAAYILLIVVVLILILVYNNTERYGEVSNLPESEQIEIDNTIRETIALNYSGNISGISNPVIRSGSFKQEYYPDGDLYISSFIVDINQIQQSYLISSLYSPTVNTGDYSRLVTCIFGDDMIFDYFNCRDRLSEENRLPHSDPILLPLLNESFVGFFVVPTSFVDNKLSISIIIDKNSPDQEKYVNEVRDFIISSNLDINNYILNIETIIIER